MSVLAHAFADPVAAAGGEVYRVRAEGRRLLDGRWEGLLVFESARPGDRLVAERETTQSHWDDLVYWASGLEPVYLEGALARARPVGEANSGT